MQWQLLAYTSPFYQLLPVGILSATWCQQIGRHSSSYKKFTPRQLRIPQCNIQTQRFDLTSPSNLWEKPVAGEVTLADGEDQIVLRVQLRVSLPQSILPKLVIKVVHKHLVDIIRIRIRNQESRCGTIRKPDFPKCRSVTRRREDYIADVYVAGGSNCDEVVIYVVADEAGNPGVEVVVAWENVGDAKATFFVCRHPILVILGFQVSFQLV